MSKFENYETISAIYDQGRVPVGAKCFISILSSYLQKPPCEVHLLDVGCGTGNYSKAFLEHGIGKISVVEGSEGMLSKAKLKLAPYITNKQVIQVKHQSVPPLPFPDNHFDVVCFMQVIHHLDTANSELPNTKAAFGEAYRILRPGGVLVINTTSQNQMEYCSWYYSLIPKSTKKYKDILISDDELRSMLRMIGFGNISQLTDFDGHHLSEDLYKNLDGPLNVEWRQLDSIWKYAEIEGEIQSAIELVSKLKAEGKLEEFYEKAEQKRKQVGSYITLFAQKP